MTNPFVEIVSDHYNIDVRYTNPSISRRPVSIYQTRADAVIIKPRNVNIDASAHENDQFHPDLRRIGKQSSHYEQCASTTAIKPWHSDTVTGSTATTTTGATVYTSDHFHVDQRHGGALNPYCYFTGAMIKKTKNGGRPTYKFQNDHFQYDTRNIGQSSPFYTQKAAAKNTKPWHFAKKDHRTHPLSFTLGLSEPSDAAAVFLIETDHCHDDYRYFHPGTRPASRCTSTCAKRAIYKEYNLENCVENILENCSLDDDYVLLSLQEAQLARPTYSGSFTEQQMLASNKFTALSAGSGYAATAPSTHMSTQPLSSVTN